MSARSELRFKNGKFKILQLTDMQDGASISPDTISFIDAAIKKENPDLIVCTGDQIKGYDPVTAAKKDKRTAARVTIETLFAPIAASGVPFAITFGNHDAYSNVTHEFLWEVYSSYENFVGVYHPHTGGYGDDCIEIATSKGTPFCIYTFDSHAGTNNGGYECIKESQVEFYERCGDALKEKYGEYPKAFVFQHIPPIEIMDCLTVAKKGDKDVFEGMGKYKGRFYKMPADVKDDGRSFMGEIPAPPDEKTRQLDAFLERGDVIGVFFGHDHRNSFITNYKGIDLGYAQCCGWGTYGPWLDRGGRVFELDENDLTKYETHTVTYRDLFGSHLQTPLRDFAMTLIPSSFYLFKKRFIKFLAASAAVGTAYAVYKYKVKK